MQKESAAFMGIDWADRKHDVCLAGAGSEKRERSVLERRPATIRQGPRSSGSVFRARRLRSA